LFKDEGVTSVSEDELFLVGDEELREQIQILRSDIKTTKNIVPLARQIRSRGELYHILEEGTEVMSNGMSAVAISGLADRLNGVAQFVDHNAEISLGEEVLEVTPKNVLDAIDRENESREFAYPLGIQKLDEQLQGGLWPGELGLIMGPTHRGKTWFLVHVTKSALVHDIPIIYFTGEIQARKVLIRTLQSLYQLPNDQIRDKKFQQAKLDTLPPFQIVHYSPGVSTTTYIKKHVRRFKKSLDSNSKRPLVILDPFDDISATDKHSKDKIELTTVTKEIRGLSINEDVGIWGGTWSTRFSDESRYVKLNEASTDINKVNRGDVVLTLGKPSASDIMPILIAKHRERDVESPMVKIRMLREVQSFE
jgi:archaellum biogenesis ATPase FlaH